MKIAVFGDAHFNNWKEFSKVVNVRWNIMTDRYEESDDKAEHYMGSELLPMNSRLLNQLNALCDLRDYCYDNEIHTVLFAGDLFHTRGSVETTVYNSVYRILESFVDKDIHMVLIGGNHDQPISMIHSENSLYPISSIHKVVSTPKIVPIFDGDEEVHIVCLPYSKDKKTILEAERKLMEQIPERISSILLAHLGIAGGLIGSGNYVMSDEYQLHELKINKFHYCIFGHYHKGQVLEYNSIYTGSLLQNTFNDEGDPHGFWVIDTQKRWDMTMVPLDYPQFITIKDQEYTGESLGNNYIRIQANANNVESIMEKLSDRDNVRLDIEKEYVANARSKISITMNIDDILSTYEKEHNDLGIDSNILIQKGREIYNKGIGER